jgi:hypothetical protein
MLANPKQNNYYWPLYNSVSGYAMDTDAWNCAVKQLHVQTIKRIVTESSGISLGV